MEGKDNLLNNGSIVEVYLSEPKESIAFDLKHGRYLAEYLSEKIEGYICLRLIAFIDWGNVSDKEKEVEIKKYDEEKYGKTTQELLALFKKALSTKRLKDSRPIFINYRNILYIHPLTK